MVSMKKSISWRQMQYLGNYLLNLEIQGEAFHVMFHGFQWKYITSFVALTFTVHFLQGSIYEGAKRTLQYMPNKNLQLPKSFIVDVWHFQWRNFEAQYPDNIYISTSRFFMMYWGFCAQKYYDINIGESYMRLFLGQSKTIV